MTSAPNGREIWQFEAIGLTENVKSLTSGNSDVVVAIIDSGIDFSHQDLGTQLQWHNPGEIPNNGIDDDNNGYIDDIHGWDFINNDNNPVPEPNGLDDNNNGLIDEFVWHGTFVAGIIVGSGKNELHGIVPNIKILDIKIFDSDGQASTQELEIWQYVASFGDKIKVINFSADLPDESFQKLNQTFELLLNISDIVIVASAGNERSDTVTDEVDYPGRHPDILAVGAVDKNLQISSFSKQGKGLDLVAPGEDIFSTVLDNLYFKGGSGTSFATPFVTGAVAFVLSLPLNKILTGSDIRDLIKNSTTDLGEIGYDTVFGSGILNMTKLVSQLSSQITKGLAGWSGIILVIGFTAIVFRKVTKHR